MSPAEEAQPAVDLSKCRYCGSPRKPIPSQYPCCNRAKCHSQAVLERYRNKTPGAKVRGPQKAPPLKGPKTHNGQFMWSAEENEILLRGISHYGHRWMLRNLPGRTLSACCNQANRLGYQFHDGRKSLRQVERETGYNFKQLRRAIDALRKKGRSFAISGGKEVPHFFLSEADEDAITEWLREETPPWSRDHPACTRCQKTDSPHNYGGLCTRCVNAFSAGIVCPQCGVRNWTRKRLKQTGYTRRARERRAAQRLLRVVN